MLIPLGYAPNQRRVKRILICLLVLIYQESFSQSIQYEAELGINASGKPYKETYGRGDGKGSSLFSPLLGFSLTTNHWKRFSLTAGIQFYTSGKKYRFHGEGTYMTVNYSQTETEKMAFTQLSFPVHLNYNFNVGKLEMYTFLGYAFSNYIKGSYEYLHELTFSQDIGRDLYIEKSFDPFSKDLKTPAKRTTDLISIGVGMKVHQRIGIQARFSTALQQLYFEEYPTQGSIPDNPNDHHYFSRSDVTLSVKYLLNK